MKNFLAVVFCLLIASPAVAGKSSERPFELWPSENGAPPAPYTKAAPTPVLKSRPWTFPGGAPVEITVDTRKKERGVTPFHFGGNAAWWNHKDWILRPDILEKVRQSGIRVWRWPGGSSSDHYFWDGNYAGHEKQSDGDDATRMHQPWAVSNDDFIEFCRQTGSEAIVTANYGVARYGSVKKAADLAAGWVRYFREKGFKVRYWEIGNENYGTWEEGTKIEGRPVLSGAEYGEDFKKIAKAIRKADKDVFIGAVAVDLDNGEEWTGYRWWMKGLLPRAQKAADFLILHQYFMWPFDSKNNYTNPTFETLFGNLPKLGQAMDAVKTMTPKYVKNAQPLPVALTEFNLMNASPKETIQLMNGLFTAEVLGEHIRAGYVASNHWDLRNGLDKKMGGDHALLAVDDPSVPEGTPRPSYYAYVLYKHAFGERMVESSSSDPQVKVYASVFSDGEPGMILVNETTRPRTATLNLAGVTPQGRFQAYVLTGKGLGAKQVTYNGEPGPKGGGGPFPVDSIPPYDGSFNPEKPLSLNLPPCSAVGLVIY